MSHTIQIDRITFDRHDGRGEDGAVWYLILSPCEECKTNPEHHCCKAHPGMKHHYERQAFRLGNHGHRLDADDEMKATNRANVWGWDGDREAPTITPSFLAAEGRPYRLHSFIRSGQLDLCGDSTVTPHPRPVPCEDT